MEKLKFILGKKKDLDEIHNVFVQAINEMEKNNIHQWDEIYPNRDVLGADIDKGQLYIGVIDNKIACVYVLSQESDEQYINGEWKYPDSSYYVIHRLCVNPVCQNKGIGTLSMVHIENELRKMNIETIRLDAFSLNPFALKMYNKLNFETVGVANWRKGKFYLMEKRI